MHKTGFKACPIIAQIFFVSYDMQSLKTSTLRVLVEGSSPRLRVTSFQNFRLTT